MEATETKPEPRLNTRTIKTLRAPAKGRRDYFDTGTGAVRGLTLRVTSKNHRSWTLIYRVPDDDSAGGDAGKKRRWTIGSADTIGLAAARKKARRALVRIEDDGIDPSTQKRIRRQRRDEALTFADLCDEYKTAKRSKRSWSASERMTRRFLLPVWRNEKLTEITPKDVETVLRKITAKGHPVMANRVHALISGMFNFAIKKDLVAANPGARIDKQPETSRDRVLTGDEIGEMWAACDDARRMRIADGEDPPAINPMIARTLQMILLTGQRPGEVAKMRRQDVDLQSGWWTIPATIAKNGEAHRVPLCQRAVEVIEEAIERGPKEHRYVFAGIKGGSVAARAVKGVKKLRDAGKLAVADIRRHDLRRTVASGMAEAGVAPHVISCMLNHVDKGARATHVYNRYSYDREKRDAIERWERALIAILEASEPARVLNFTR